MRGNTYQIIQLRVHGAPDPYRRWRCAHFPPSIFVPLLSEPQLQQPTNITVLQSSKFAKILAGQLMLAYHRADIAKSIFLLKNHEINQHDGRQNIACHV